MLNWVEHEKCFITSLKHFINRKNFLLNWVEHEKRFITSGPGNSANFTILRKT